MYCGIDKSNVHVLYKPYFQQYALYILHWIKALIALPLFCSDFFNGDDTMDTILDMTKKNTSSICFCLLQTDVAWNNFFCSCRVITLFFFTK